MPAALDNGCSRPGIAFVTADHGNGLDVTGNHLQRLDDLLLYIRQCNGIPQCAHLAGRARAERVQIDAGDKRRIRFSPRWKSPLKPIQAKRDDSLPSSDIKIQRGESIHVSKQITGCRLVRVRLPIGIGAFYKPVDSYAYSRDWRWQGSCRRDRKSLLTQRKIGKAIEQMQNGARSVGE